MLLRAHQVGGEAMALQARQIAAGTHLHQRALTSLMEDGGSACDLEVVARHA